MGNFPTISADRFPRQGPFLGKSVDVVFHHDTTCSLRGKIIRHDLEPPNETIILLANGWVVRAAECQHSPPRD